MEPVQVVHVAAETAVPIVVTPVGSSHFLSIEEWSGRKPRQLTVPAMRNGRQKIVVDFEDGGQVSVSSTSMDRAWKVLHRRLTRPAP